MHLVDQEMEYRNVESYLSNLPELNINHAQEAGIQQMDLVT